MNERMVATRGGWLGCWLGLAALSCSGASAVVGGNDNAGAGGQSSVVPTGQASVKRAWDRLRSESGLCLPYELPLDANGAAACKVFAGTPGVAGACTCDRNNRAPVSEETRDAARAFAKASLLCDQPDLPNCGDYCVCEDVPAAGADLSACLASEEADLDGWCYVAPAKGLGTLDTPCAGEIQATVRFLGGARFSEGEDGFMACSRASSTDAKPRALGSVCVPSDERDPTFSGFREDEVVIDTGANSCASGICVVQQFRGRVSCPSGSVAGAGACLLPNSPERVAVEVVPQLLSRPPSLTATCSCRCAGPGDGPFCACDEGLACVPLVADLGLPGDGAAGSYCVPKRAAKPLPSDDPTTCHDTPEQCIDRLY